MIAQKQMRLRCTAVLGLITLLCAIGVAAAQNQLRVDVRLVNVFATITDASGRYVDGLNQCFAGNRALQP